MLQSGIRPKAQLEEYAEDVEDGEHYLGMTRFMLRHKTHKYVMRPVLSKA